MKSTIRINNFEAKIAVVDDDLGIRTLLTEVLAENGCTVEQYGSGDELLLDAFGDVNPSKLITDSSYLALKKFDLIISDINMRHVSGNDLLRVFQAKTPQIPVVLITAFGTIDHAVEALHHGAFHYLVKPFKISELLSIIRKALEMSALQEDNELLRQQINKSFELGNGIIGKSKSMLDLFEVIKKIAPSSANVLITGESGTGKELIARAIHKFGPRKNAPFIAINCTAIPETLLESELFGHAKGSFTGAHQRKKGLIEEAQGGTLFLDEIGDMSQSMQAKLLRVLQDKHIRSVGDNRETNVDVRILTATNKDLKSALKQGSFREDLYYRISVIPVRIPPLRERKEDIPMLIDYFLRKYSAINGFSKKSITKRALRKLTNYQFEGNVRELENLIERAVVLASTEVIDECDFQNHEILSSTDAESTTTDQWPTLEDLERRYIEKVLAFCDGKKDKTAQILGVNRRTLYRKEREYGWVTDLEDPGSSPSTP